ncbi:MAG TPA: P1 family peptidase, partial [Candidatus Sulfomarinibacteraceae bacterium]|nr:P1 family peptidase [Candidatus Sulfomarinibacteraceae bacterium]
HNGSGDLCLAFATGTHIPAGAGEPVSVKMMPNQHMNPLFSAVAEAVEEAILNTLTAAETMTGYKGHTAHALPLEAVREIMKGRGVENRDWRSEIGD